MTTLTAEIERGIEAGQHIGAQVYASVAGEAVIDAAWGQAKPGVPMTSDTLMVWFSCTKPVVAAAVLQLVERGELTLEDRIARVIPEFSAGGKESLTLRHLLTHTGGFPQFYYSDKLDPDENWEESVVRACAQPLQAGWVPGETAGYHMASSWYVLGELIRRMDGRRPGQYVREEIFLPLEMRDSWLGLPIEEQARYGDRIGVMHRTSTGEAVPIQSESPERMALCNPAGNARGPARELGAFYEMLLGSGERNGVRILKPETVAAMTARQREGKPDLTFRKTIDWGLGVILDSKRYSQTEVPYQYGPHASDATFGHGGVEASLAFADPARQLAAVLIFNGMPGAKAHHARMERAVKALYEAMG